MAIFWAIQARRGGPEPLLRLMPIVGEPIPYLVRPLGVDIMPKLRFCQVVKNLPWRKQPNF